MKHAMLQVLLALAAAGAAAQEVTQEQIRTVPVPGSENMVVVVSRLTVPVGATIPLHTHPGDEHVVVLGPARATAPNGQEITFEAGQTIHFPMGQVHGGLTNVGDAPMVAITTHVVDRTQPMSVPAN